MPSAADPTKSTASGLVIGWYAAARRLAIASSSSLSGVRLCVEVMRHYRRGETVDQLLAHVSKPGFRSRRSWAPKGAMTKAVAGVTDRATLGPPHAAATVCQN